MTKFLSSLFTVSRVRMHAVLGVLALSLIASNASAETLAMPARTAIKGTAVVVWGATDQSGAFTLDFGDGSTATGTVGGSFTAPAGATCVTGHDYIACTHVYTVANATPGYTVVLTANGQVSPGNLIKVYDSTTLTAGNLRALTINNTIQDGLRYLWTRQSDPNIGSLNSAQGATSMTNFGDAFPQTWTAMVTTAFENQGYTLGDGNANGIYEKYIVRRGLNYVADQLAQQSLGNKTLPNPGPNSGAVVSPCVGTGIEAAPCVGLISSANSGDTGYQTAIAILPFAASGVLTNTVPAGLGSLNSNYVAGKTYGEIIQRLANSMAAGQATGGVSSEGGWTYTLFSNSFDGSTIGWAMVGLAYAKAAGATLPPWEQTEFSVGFNTAFNNDGTFDYNTNGDPNTDSNVGVAINGIALQGMAYLGQQADLTSFPTWGFATNSKQYNAVKQINARWPGNVTSVTVFNAATGTNQTSGESWQCGGSANWNFGCAYAMFNNFKGLKLQGIVTLPNVGRAADSTHAANDWYAAYQDWLVSNQNVPTTTSGGDWHTMSFSSQRGPNTNNSVTAAIAELILSPVALVLPDPALFSSVGLCDDTLAICNAANPVNSIVTNSAFAGTSHTVTAWAQTTSGTGVAGTSVTFNVTAGPNVGTTGVSTTDSNGKATFTYPDTGGAGTDTIEATIGTATSNDVTMLWIPIGTTATATGGTFTYDGHPRSGSCSVVGDDSNVLVGTISYSPGPGAPTNAGTYTVSCDFAASGNYSAATTATATLTINPADATCSVTPYNVTYNGASHTATGSCVGVGTDGVLAGLILTGTTHTAAGTYGTDSWTFTDVSGNYNNTSGTVSDVIAKAPSITTVTCPASVTYTASPITSCTAAVTGVGGLSQAVAPVTYTANTNVGTANASATFTGDANHTASTGTNTFSITKANATCTVTPYNVIYNSAAHTATGSCVGVGADGVLAGLNLSGTTHTPGGTYGTDPWTFTDVTGNYNNASGTVSDTISKAAATCTVTPYGVTYNGSAHTASGSCTGVGADGVLPAGDLTLTGTTHTNAGTYVDTWSLHDPNGNYADQTGTVTDSIDPAPSTTTVTCNPVSVTFTGSDQTPCTAMVTGVGGLSQSLTAFYSNNTDAGTATALAVYSGDPNHTGSSGTATFAIVKAPSTVTVTGGTFVYDGAAHAATAVAGTSAGLLSNPTAVTVTYSGSCAAAPTSVTQGTSCTATGTYLGDANHNGSTGTASVTITRAPLTITASSATVTYGGAVPTITPSFSAFQGADTSAVVTGTSCTTAYTPTTSVAASPVATTCAGGAAANYSLSYVSGTVTINQAASNVTVTGGTFVYDGHAHPATAVAGTSVGTLSNPNAVTLTYSGSCGSAPTSVDQGTSCVATGTYAGDVNHSGSTSTATVTITLAPSTVTVTGGTFPYDGQSHGATGVASTTGGTLAAPAFVTLTYSGSCTAAPTSVAQGTACTATGTYLGDDNHSGSTSTAPVTITPVSATCSVTPYNVPYDNRSHTATGSCTGAGGVVLPAGDLTLTTTHTNAGTYATDSWSFHDPSGNYVDQTGTVSDVITAVSATCTVTPYAVPYDTHAHAATGSCRGVRGASLPSSDLTLPASQTNVGTYATDSWSFHDPGGNYLDQTATITDTISAAPLTITASSATVTYGAATPAITPSFVGFLGADTATTALSGDLVCLTAYTSTTPVASSPVTTSCSGATAANYAISYVPGAVTINPATSSVAVTGGTFVYDGHAHVATALASTSVGTLTNPTAVTITYSGSCGIAPTTVDQGFNCVATATYAGDANHSGSSSTATLTITPAPSSVTVTGGSFVYDGQAHQGTAVASTTGGSLSAPALVFVAYSGSCAVAPTTIVQGTTCTVTGTYAGDANHTGSTGTGTVVITRAPLTITASSATVVYGSAVPTITPSYSGFQGSEGPFLVRGNSCATAYTPTSNVGTTPATTCAGGTTDNYAITYVAGTVTITAATPVCTVTPYSVTYDTAGHTAAAACTGVGGIALPASDLSLAGTTHTNAGSYPADSWSFADGNYVSQSGTITDTISQAPLTITASSTTLTYGSAVPTITASYSAFQGTEGSDVVAGNTCTTAYTATTPVASSPVATSCAGGTAANYSITYVPGAVTITPATAACSVTPYTVAYDTTAHTATGACTGVGGATLPTGDLTLTGTTHTNAGTYSADSWSFADANYLSQTATITDTIGPAASSVTVTGGVFVFDGNAHAATAGASTTVGTLSNPSAVTITYSGTCSSAPTTVADGGNCTATGTYAGDANHSGSTNTAKVVITPAPIVATGGSGSSAWDGTPKTPSACVVSGAYTGGLTCTNNPATVGPNPGTTPIAPVIAANGNFAIALVNGSFTIGPIPAQPAACSITYPFASANPLTSTAFNESTVLAGVSHWGVGASETIRVWYNDEHAITLGVRQVQIKTASGTTSTNYAMTALPSVYPASAMNPSVGSTSLTGDQAGTDLSGRLLSPVLFITDVTSNASSLSGDWQSGGTAVAPHAIYGTWKSAVRLVDKTHSPSVVTITPDADPATKNGWSLGAGSDPVPTGLANEGYGAELVWNVSQLGLLPGHTYRIQVIVHDGDQNQTGGDTGESCVNVVKGVDTQAWITTVNEAFTTNFNQTVTAGADKSLLKNDTTPNSLPLSVATINGSAANVGTPITTAQGGTLTVNANGTFTYKPAIILAGYTETFTYTDTDGTSSPSTTGTVTITVGAGTAPTVKANPFNMNHGTTLNQGGAGVLGGATNPNGGGPGGGPLTAQLVSGPSVGTLTLNANGTFTFTPPPTFVGTVTFQYQAVDGLGLTTNVATGTITVK